MTLALKRDQRGAYSIEPLNYKEWVADANKHQDQDWIWRQHELYARINYQRERAFRKLIDVGGES